MSSHKPSRRPLWVGTLAGLLATILILPSSSRAADLDPGFVDVPAPIPQQNVAFGSGWYIRGDIGGNRGLSVKAGEPPYENIYTGPGQAAPGITVARSNDLSYTASLGGGYAFTRWFRADVTFDYNQETSNTYRGIGRPCITGTAIAPNGGEQIYSTTCTPNLKARLNSYDALINGYIDLGTWSILTPYVGAGVGLSFGDASTSSAYIQGNGASYDVTYTDALNGASYNQYWDRSQSTRYYNLAFALMGGVAIDIYDHVKLDVGYRYLSLGTVLGTKLQTHQVRVGFRYMIDN